MMNLPKCLLWACWGISLIALPAAADDWPQWMGPKRDSHWRETGIVDRFPADGLTFLWKAPVGLGYSGPAVVGQRVLVTDYVIRDGQIVNSPGGRSQLQGQERVICLDATSGRQLWVHAYDRPYNLSYAGGPRATPTCDEGRAYVLGAEGDLWCLDIETGNVIWSKQLAEQYQVEAPFWGYCSHPLVDGDRLICLVGGEGTAAVAFDKHTGKELWRALSASDPGYCPPTMIEAGGKRQLLIWLPDALHSLNPATGELYWEQPLQPSYSMSIAAPRKEGDLLFASGIGNAGAVFKLDATRPAAEVLWRGTPRTGVYCSNSTPYLHEGIIYGNDCQVGDLRAVRLQTGERLWQTFQPTTGGSRRESHGTAFLVRHQDRFFLFSETGHLILARLTPEGYHELDRFQILEPTNEALGRPVVWSHPAFAHRCVFARNDRQIVCVSLAEEQ